MVIKINVAINERRNQRLQELLGERKCLEEHATTTRYEIQHLKKARRVTRERIRKIDVEIMREKERKPVLKLVYDAGIEKNESTLQKCVCNDTNEKTGVHVMKYQENKNHLVKERLDQSVSQDDRGLRNILTGSQLNYEKLQPPVKFHMAPKDIEPEEIIVIVTHLIAWYQRSRSTQLALSITQYIEALVSHCDADTLDDHVLCEYQRLSKHWAYIASQKPKFMSFI